ncbi:hypothetical protein [Pedobacter insulae]|uniref:Uncharacterized protein n=1 Tax=Pedobacter insulae TaxID=414048 RepID=A0A1I2V2T6_9SPHI|nr:hypothetical protein [Pedobacter insulae]SFG83303.1 hypothetical protein SAMN04489864_102465 [Pedobacter insulae]
MRAVFVRGLILGMALLIIGSCTKPDKDIVITFNTASLFKSPFLVRFEKANPNATTQIGDFAITISGKDAALVQMGSGGTDFKVSQGMIPLALRGQAKPTKANPLTFVINAEIAGFETIHKTITVTNDSSLVFIIPAFDFVKRVDGTAFTTMENDLKAGVTTSIINLNTSTTATMAEKVNLTIPVGTEMRDASNKLIDASMLKSTLIAHNNSATSMAALFPSGIVGRNAIKSGAYVPFGVNFVPAGAIRLVMYADNKVVANFSKPIEVSQELPAGLINYDTKAAVKAGETIPLWYTTVVNGEQRLMTTPVAITTGTGGKLIAKYTITTPNIWNLSWGWSPVKSDLNKELTINFAPSQAPFTGTYNTYLYTSTSVFLKNFTNYQPARDFFQVGKLVNNTTTFSTITGKYGYSLPTSPDVPSAKVVVYSSAGKLVGQSALFTPATTTSITINIDNSPVVVVPPGPVTPPTPIEYVNITTSFTSKCISKNIIAPLNAWMTVNDVTDNTFSYVYIKNGVIDNPTASIKLIVGHKFKISSSYNGVTYSTGTFPISKSNVDIPAAAENFSATSTYNSATSTISIVGVFSLECK